MELKVFSKKPSITYGDYDYLDLSDNSLLGVFKGIIGLETVTSDYQMRIDLISLKWYGSTSHSDIILKANNLFNPFAIKEGDVLIIPVLKEESAMFKKGTIIQKNKVREQFLDTSRMSSSDIAKLKILMEKSKNRKNKLANPLPTNMLQQDISNKVFEDGAVKLTEHHSIRK